ncbi:MAG TPA: efflux RND transporter periplasmic adaptor subunit [Patescibacteria group bacterium]|nr:efflux RND transporter periplasmic adaptor subunit [Patescibacteria group bacterium]
MIVMLVLIGLILGGIFGFEAFRARMIQRYLASAASQPQTISTIVAETQEWQLHLDALGSLTAVQGTDLSFEVAGIVDSMTFDSGQDVNAGEPLARLRADDDLARLHSLDATADLAAITYRRDEKQLQVHAVSQATLDADDANLKNARAQVAQQQAILDKKVLKAPFAGRLGIRAVDFGQYLNSGTAVVGLQALAPIYADFTLPQQEFSHVATGQGISAEVDTYPGQVFAGEISAIDPKVDPASRNIDRAHRQPAAP